MWATQLMSYLPIPVSHTCIAEPPLMCLKNGVIITFIIRAWEISIEIPVMFRFCFFYRTLPFCIVCQENYIPYKLHRCVSIGGFVSTKYVSKCCFFSPHTVFFRITPGLSEEAIINVESLNFRYFFCSNHSEWSWIQTVKSWLKSSRKAVEEKKNADSISLVCYLFDPS